MRGLEECRVGAGGMKGFCFVYFYIDRINVLNKT